MRGFKLYLVKLCGKEQSVVSRPRLTSHVQQVLLICFAVLRFFQQESQLSICVSFTAQLTTQQREQNGNKFESISAGLNYRNASGNIWVGGSVAVLKSSQPRSNAIKWTEHELTSVTRKLRLHLKLQCFIVFVL